MIKNTNKKIKQIDIETKEIIKIWDSAYKASEYYKISTSKIKQSCNLEVPYEGFLWEWLDLSNKKDEMIKVKKPKEKQLHNKKCVHLIHAITEVEQVQKENESIKEFSDRINVEHHTLRKVVNGYCRSVNKYVLKETYGNFENNKFFGVELYCIKTDSVIKVNDLTLKIFAEKNNVPYKSINALLNNKVEQTHGYVLLCNKEAYLSKTQNKKESVEYNKKNKNETLGIPKYQKPGKEMDIYHVEYDSCNIIKVYNSYKDAAKSFDIKSGAVASFVRTNRGVKTGRLTDFKYYKGNLVLDKDTYEFYKTQYQQILTSKRANGKVCKMCNKPFDNKRQLSSHIQMSHNVDVIDYTIKHLFNGIRPGCKECGKETRYCTYDFMPYCLEHATLAMSIGGTIGGKASAWSKGRTKYDDPRLMDYSRRYSGINNPMYGRRLSEESIEKSVKKNRLSLKEINERLSLRYNHFSFDFDYSNYKDRGTFIVDCKCNKCGYVSHKRMTAVERGSLCRKCYPVGVSKDELEVGDYISFLVGKENIVRSDRTLLSPKEVDIYVPNKNVAVEYNGLYWHSEKMLKESGREGDLKLYHQNKTDGCKEKNVDLFHVFSDEWMYKKDIVKSMIRKLVGNTKKLDSISAENDCVINEVTLEDVLTFIEENTVQDIKHGDSSKYFGLYYMNELISVMSTVVGDDGRVFISSHTDKKDFIVENSVGVLLNVVVEYYTNNNVKELYVLPLTRLLENKKYEEMGFVKLDGCEYVEEWITDGYVRYSCDEEDIIEDEENYKVYGCVNSLYVLLY